MLKPIALAAALVVAVLPSAQAAQTCRDACAAAGKKDCDKACPVEKAKPGKGKEGAKSTRPAVTAQQGKGTEGGYGLCDR